MCNNGLKTEGQGGNKEDQSNGLRCEVARRRCGVIDEASWVKGGSGRRHWVRWFVRVTRSGARIES